jgi:hypothetical protein
MMVEKPNTPMIFMEILCECIGQQTYLLDRRKLMQKKDDPVKDDPWWMTTKRE